MLGTYVVLLAFMVAVPMVAQTGRVSVVIDTSEAQSVLQAVQDPRLTNEQALAIAKLPGSQGIIRKALSYDRPASDALFARALVAAAHHDADFKDSSRFRFDVARNNAAQISDVLGSFSDPKLQLFAKIKTRVSMFTPAGLDGTVTGHLVLGGTAYGFAFGGEPAMYLDLEHVLSATLASKIFEHELFHAIQILAKSRHQPSQEANTCLARKQDAKGIEDLLNALSMEGTASYVGDLLALPEHDLDEPTTKERADFAHIIDQRERHITQLELSVHGFATRAAVTWQQVYAAGFYGDQPFYGIGYVMSKAIVQEQGNVAIADLISQSGAAFVLRYVNLNSYGKSSDVPALGKETVLWAKQIASCRGRE